MRRPGGAGKEPVKGLYWKIGPLRYFSVIFSNTFSNRFSLYHVNGTADNKPIATDWNSHLA